jgi:hypothetical protein
VPVSLLAIFRSRDVVLIADEPGLVEDGPGLEGVVDQVRRMDDGTFEYVVASLGDEHIETVPGLYAERQLVATGKRVNLSDVPYLSDISGPLGRREESIKWTPRPKDRRDQLHGRGRGRAQRLSAHECPS